MRRLGIKDLKRRVKAAHLRVGRVKAYTFGIIYGRSTASQIQSAMLQRRVAYVFLRTAQHDLASRLKEYKQT